MNPVTIPMRSTLIAVLVLFTWSQLLPNVCADQGKGQRHMRHALALLEAAKTAEKPVANLNAARKALATAKKNKEGERVDALGYIKEAIAYATTGDKKAANERIDKAISSVKSGIARAN
jgi:Sec-independent protein translocase protein TatA